MTRQDLIKGAKIYFTSKPELLTILGTEDGHFFYPEHKSDGVAHANTNKIAYFVINRDEVMTDSKPEFVQSNDTVIIEIEGEKNTYDKEMICLELDAKGVKYTKKDSIEKLAEKFVDSLKS